MALSLAAEEAEAEAAAAEAAATAAQARARAAALRRQAADAERESAEQAARDDTETTLVDEPARETGTPRRRGRGLRRPPRPGRKAAAALAAVLTCAAVGASAYMLWQHRDAQQQRQRAAEFEAAARQGVVTLTSLDFNNAQADVQRVLDNSTGGFRDDFRSRATDFTSVIQQSKVATEGTVNSTAVESMTDDSAVVLVAATSKVTNAAGANQEPRSWRLSVTVTRDGGQLKMSKVDFVP